jgi:hypothetical protein
MKVRQNYSQFWVEKIRSADHNSRMCRCSVSFARDIAPLFSPRDVACMSHLDVHLKDPAYMTDATGNEKFPDHANAREVYARLTGEDTPRMPMGGPYWSDAQLQLLSQWMTDGFQA